jgi:nitronate monooxygenase
VRPGEHDQVAFARDGSPIERYSDVIPTQELSGDLEALALYAGESSARVRAVRPAAAIVTELVDQALRALNAA